jgi:hypothetical protein
MAEEAKMRSGRFVLAIAVLVTLLVAAEKIGAAADGAGLASWKGSASQIREPWQGVVENPADWSALWQRAFGEPAPDVDFRRYVVACVFLGHRADWLYAISLGNPEEQGGRWVIPWSLAPLVLELAKPFRARGQYLLKVYERPPGGLLVLDQHPQTPVRW